MNQRICYVNLTPPEQNNFVPTTNTSDLLSTEVGRNVRRPPITAGLNTTLQSNRYYDTKIVSNVPEETSREHCSRRLVETDSCVPTSSKQDDRMSSAVQEVGEFTSSLLHVERTQDRSSEQKSRKNTVSDLSGTVAAVTESALKSHDGPDVVRTQRGVPCDDELSLRDHTDEQYCVEFSGNSQSDVQHQAAANRTGEMLSTKKTGEEEKKHRQEIEKLSEANQYQARLICQLRAQLEDQDKKIVELNQRIALSNDPNLSDLIKYQIDVLREDFTREKQEKERLMSEKKSLEKQVDTLHYELERAQRRTESS